MKDSLPVPKSKPPLENRSRNKKNGKGRNASMDVVLSWLCNDLTWESLNILITLEAPVIEGQSYLAMLEQVDVNLSRLRPVSHQRDLASSKPP